MTLDEMRMKKEELLLTAEMIAQASGVPLSTVQKIFSGSTQRPRRATIEAIEGAIIREEQRRGHRYQQPQTAPGMLKDTSAPYGTGAERLYTIEDYYALPEERRVELIDGVFYDMAAPAMLHQIVLGELYLLFRECADSHGIPCEVILSPCDVRLDRDDYTMVQPDLLVICRDYDIRAVRYEGAPDLVVEILSDSTRSKDLILKLYKYQKAGVREYWIVDPRHLEVTVHCFEEEDYHPHLYHFDDQIPVGISGGECRIDFTRIRKRMPCDL